jgi:hypothetical protein
MEDHIVSRDPGRDQCADAQERSLAALARARNEARTTVVSWMSEMGAAGRLVTADQCPRWGEYDAAEKALAAALVAV